MFEWMIELIPLIMDDLKSKGLCLHCQTTQTQIRDNAKSTIGILQMYIDELCYALGFLSLYISHHHTLYLLGFA